MSNDLGPGSDTERDLGDSPALDAPVAAVTTTSRTRDLIAKRSVALDRVRTSAPGTYWNRLNAVDFMTSATQFSALAILCLVPVLLIVATETGHDIRQTLASRMGLNPQAANDLDKLISSGHQAVVCVKKSTPKVVGRTDLSALGLRGYRWSGGSGCARNANALT